MDRAVTTTSDEAWGIDPGDGSGEHSLNTEGWSVKTVGGSRYDLPSRRGENIEFAYRPGAVHRVKTPEPRIITLVMWVTSLVDTAAVVSQEPPITDGARAFNDNWDFLRRLVWTHDGRQVRLVRRWKLSSHDQDSPLLVADAMAELRSSMEPHMTGRTRAEFVLDFVLADPYFFGAPVQVELGEDPTEVVNPGHDTAAYRYVSLVVHGPCVNPSVVNTGPGVSVHYQGSLSSDQNLWLDVSGFRAVAPHLSQQNVIGSVTHTGARYWFGLVPTRGDFHNHVYVTADSGTPTATLVFRPPYV